MNKRGQVVSQLINGTGGLIITVVIVLVITSTILTANLFENSRITSLQTAQALTVGTSNPQTFGNSTLQGSSCAIDLAVNATNLSQVIDSGNYTVDATECTVVGNTGSSFNDTSWSINSSTTYEGSAGSASEDLQSNFTSGIRNVSVKIPVILLIGAVVLLFGVLIILVARSRQMGIGGGGSL